MIRLPDRDLPPDAAARLLAWQSEIDSIPNFADRVVEAKRAFSRRNNSRDAIFTAVRATLASMCSGARRCCYCEDSMADEVEHIKPKDLYPESVFAWANYLYACGPCNGPKNSRFAVYPAGAAKWVDVTRTRNDPILPPVPGDPVLIDPRREDPLSFLEIDLQDTFLFVPIYGLPGRDEERALYTIDVLRLNVRDVLVTARREAYGSYRARLFEYRSRKKAGDPHIQRLKSSLQRMGHPTVWREMQRQQRSVPELHELFGACPEALDW